MRLIVILLLLFAQSVVAQPLIDIASLNYSYHRPLKFTNNESATLQYTNAFLTLPIRSGNNIFIINPSFDRFDFKFRQQSKLYMNGQIALTWQHQWKDKRFKTALVVIPKSISESKYWLKKDSYQIGGAILQTYQRSEQLSYKLGLYCNSEFFGPYFLPLLGIDYRITPRWNLWGILPSSLNGEYKAIINKLHFIISLKTMTLSYRKDDSYYLRTNDNLIRIAADFYVNKQNVLFLETGHSVFRKFVLGTKNHNIDTQSTLSVQNSWMVRVGYAYRVRLDKL